MGLGRGKCIPLVTWGGVDLNRAASQLDIWMQSRGSCMQQQLPWWAPSGGLFGCSALAPCR